MQVDFGFHFTVSVFVVCFRVKLANLENQVSVDLRDLR